MNRERLKELYVKYELTKEDIFKHQHYVIITRPGIEKIQAVEGIKISFEVVRSEPNFAAVKAKSELIETFGSALYGKKKQNPDTKKWEDTGTCNTLYVLEMAEKRALSRLVLKQTGFYELGVFGEDESEDFKKND